MTRELNFFGESPLLYLVATPIGNQKELSPRAIEILSSCDFIACEDSRHSGTLLHSFNISKPLISCHEHNEEEASSKIIALLKEGKQIAYISDAGYPAISDPGERLVKRCLKEGIKVSSISGSNAALNALITSGLDTSKFYFHGFLSPKENERKKELEALKDYPFTLIFYEAPHRIDKTLKSMKEVLGNREASIGRELTKKHEEIIRGNLDELSSINPDTLKGEMVIVISGKKESKESVDEEKIKARLTYYLDKGYKSKEAIEFVKEELHVNKKAVYAACLLLKNQ